MNGTATDGSINRLEISFQSTMDKIMWQLEYMQTRMGSVELKVEKLIGSVSATVSDGSILNIEEGDGGSLVVYFEGGNVCTCWFTSMVKADKSILEANMEYTVPSKFIIGNLHWNHSTKTITEEYREGAHLTDDDFHLLGRFKCTDCGRFLCECWIEEVTR